MEESQENQLRREAIDLYFVQKLGKAEICRKLQRSRPWLDRWLKRYNPDQVDKSLQDRSKAPTQPSTTWMVEMRERVLALHTNRKQKPFTLHGAQAIHYELEHLGFDPAPSVRTIHRWLDEAGLVASRKKPERNKSAAEVPLPKANTVNAVHQLDLKGPILIRNDATKYYWAVLHELYGKSVSLAALTSREAAGITSFLLASWRWMGVPHYLQMDNALEFRGSNRYPRSFGSVVRLALAVGAEVFFIPQHQPCYNGCVERYNGFLEERLHPIPFANLEEMQSQIAECQRIRNREHRIRALNGKTPGEVLGAAQIRLPDADLDLDKIMTTKPKQGFVTFVRRVRKSGRITLGGNDRFMVDPALVGCYVAARVDIARHNVTISLAGESIVTYDYTHATVGEWANGKT